MIKDEKSFGALLRHQQFSARKKAKIASLEHLLDLKRAGFRGGHGELDVPRCDGLAKEYQPSALAYMSMIGSPSHLAEAG